jgi:hypothetical protein
LARFVLRRFTVTRGFTYKNDDGEIVTKVTVLDRYDDDNRPFNDGESVPVRKLIADLSALVDSVPSEYRDFVELSVEHEYSLQLEVSYERPATATEIAAYEEQRAASKRGEEEREKRILAGLLSKYGPT